HKSSPLDTQRIPFHSKTSWNDTFEIVTKAGSLWCTEVQKAIDRGNLYHFLLSKIIHKTDLQQTITTAINNGLLPESEKEQVSSYLLEVVSNPKLTNFYSDQYEIYIERDLYTQEGTILRPDRFMIQDNKVNIIDYKTGS